MTMTDTEHLHPGDQVLLDFVDSFRKTQTWAHDVNRANGFWDELELIQRVIGDNTPTLSEKILREIVLARMALIHSEPSEAVEAVRKHPQVTWGTTEKDSLASELAGTIVRCMDIAAWLGLPLAEAIVAEVNRNSKRGYMHGGQAA